MSEYTGDGLVSGDNPLAAMGSYLSEMLGFDKPWLSAVSNLDSNYSNEGRYKPAVFEESYSGPMSLGWDGSGAAKDERSFFERMGDGLVSAAEKDPLRVAQAGLGALYGAYKDMKTDKQLKAQYDIYASRIAAEKEAKDQYNASFGGAGKTRGSTKGPATRVNGQRIYNDNGTMKRG